MKHSQDSTVTKELFLGTINWARATLYNSCAPLIFGGYYEDTLMPRTMFHTKCE